MDGTRPKAKLKRYEQLAELISELIRAGVLRPGEQVPSIRKLSAARHMSPGTVQQAEVAARAARVGLWHDASPVPPWEWRHKK